MKIRHKPMRKLQQDEMYVIVNPSGEAQPITLRYLRKHCVKDFLKDSTVTWKQAIVIGWRCKKVIVTIVPEKK